MLENSLLLIIGAQILLTMLNLLVLRYVLKQKKRLKKSEETIRGFHKQTQALICDFDNYSKIRIKELCSKTIEATDLATELDAKILSVSQLDKFLEEFINGNDIDNELRTRISNNVKLELDRYKDDVMTAVQLEIKRVSQRNALEQVEDLKAPLPIKPNYHPKEPDRVENFFESKYPRLFEMYKTGMSIEDISRECGMESGALELILGSSKKRKANSF